MSRLARYQDRANKVLTPAAVLYLVVYAVPIIFWMRMSRSSRSNGLSRN